VPFTVRPLSDIAISLVLPEKAPATTSHLLALQDNYVSRIPGDWTSQTQLPAATTVKSWPFLTGVDVDAPPRGGVVVAFGDSTVDGDGSTANMNHRLTDVLAERLQRDERTRRFGVVNTGIVGNRLLRNTPHDPPNDFGDFMGESGLGRVERDALEEPGAIAVIVRIGLNDIAFPGAVSSTTDSIAAAELIAGYRALVAAAHRRRVRIIGTTVTPFEQATLAPLFFTPAKDAVRQEVNTWIRSSGVFDAVIDADRILRDPTHITRLLPAFDSGDHLHTNERGLRRRRKRDSTLGARRSVIRETARTEGGARQRLRCQVATIRRRWTCVEHRRHTLCCEEFSDAAETRDAVLSYWRRCREWS
jgi:lysophospholipase L1-like esterase